MWCGRSGERSEPWSGYWAGAWYLLDVWGWGCGTGPRWREESGRSWAWSTSWSSWPAKCGTAGRRCRNASAISPGGCRRLSGRPFWRLGAGWRRIQALPSGRSFGRWWGRPWGACPCGRRTGKTFCGLPCRLAMRTPRCSCVP